MDRFLELLREEYEKELRIGGNYSSKERLLQAFDKASIRAMMKYAKEKNIDISI